MGGEGGQPDALHVFMVVFGFRGGMAQYSSQIANTLGEHVEVTVVAPERSEVTELLDDSIQVQRFPHPESRRGKLGTIVAGVAAISAINKHLLRRRPDVVHIPFLAGLPSIVVIPLLWLHRLPLIGTIHDPISHEGQEIDILGVDLRLAALLQVSRALDAIVVHGQECKEQAVEAGYPPEKIRVLQHGLYTHFEAADQADSTVADGENVLLFFGKIRPNKGFDRIPEIVDGVAEEVEDVTAVVAGTSDVGWQIDRDTLNQMIDELRSHDRIDLHDRYIPNEEVGKFFRGATAVVLPYYDATASGVAMISYTFEKPLVATRTGDMGRMVERDQTGILADPASDAELVDAAIDVLTDPEIRQRLTENIRDRKDQYAWSTIGQRTIALYRDVVAA